MTERMETDAPELTPVRETHRFDEAALAQYLAARLPGFAGHLEVLQFEGGQSNPTYLLRSGESEWVLRKQPTGKLLPSAHQVDREHRVMKALEETAVPVPRMHLLCEDPSVIGTKFYVMEHVRGRIFFEPAMGASSPTERRAVYDDLAGVLARLHAVDYRAVGLETFGRPGNYFARQIGRWTKQYLASKTEEIEAMDRLLAWLPEHVPSSDETVIVHGDFRLGNTIVHPSEPRIVAVLDWELSTLGHPLADLGYVCQAYHTEPDDVHGLNRPDLEELGIPTEEQFVARYCELAARPPIEDFTFYLVYNLFRSAAIIQGVYKRGLDGTASSERALEFAGYCRSRAERGWALVEQR